ncbi:MAG: D-beta-D-heptose 1-phosphate adenosyltransferase [Chitinophagaceae bacterium]|nr:D-beta-D-heptose 1-phosphate adenosyltransferase [Chitinophagaceae bacterium]
MKQSKQILQKLFNAEELKLQLKRWDLLGKKIVFTNGVFDILHHGHIQILSEAATYADVLIVGVNSDASVKRLKGNSRPINGEASRAFILSALLMVDAVIIFEEDTPLELIKLIKPDVLVKGGDYTLDTIVGAKEVIANGGEVKIIPLEEGFSTTAIIKKIKN